MPTYICPECKKHHDSVHESSDQFLSCARCTRHAFAVVVFEPTRGDFVRGPFATHEDALSWAMDVALDDDVRDMSEDERDDLSEDELGFRVVPYSDITS